MTKREAAIVAAYTGYLIGDFGEMAKYAEEKFGHPIFTHSFGDERVATKLRESSKEDFINIKVN